MSEDPSTRRRSTLTKCPICGGFDLFEFCSSHSEAEIREFQAQHGVATDCCTQNAISEQSAINFKSWSRTTAGARKPRPNALANAIDQALAKSPQAKAKAIISALPKRLIGKLTPDQLASRISRRRRALDI